MSRKKEEEQEKLDDAMVNPEPSRIDKLSRGTDDLTSKKEDEVLSRMKDLTDVVAEINSKQDQIKNSGKMGPDGLYPKLSVIELSKIRNEILTLKNVKKGIKSQISRLNKELKSEYKKKKQKNLRGNLRISARRESYHNRNSSSIEDAISKMVEAMQKDDIDSLAAQLSTLDSKKADTLLMHTLLKAPHHLHTKVVANANVRAGYLQYFRSLLKKGKKK